MSSIIESLSCTKIVGIYVSRAFRYLRQWRSVHRTLFSMVCPKIRMVSHIPKNILTNFNLLIFWQFVHADNTYTRKITAF